MSKANRKYNDSVFKSLFGEEESALNLYNALTDNNFTIEDGLRFTTLDNVLFMDRVNDISFTIGEKLVVLIEHQATINKNMPLRALLYIARIYEKIIDNKSIYRTNLFKIPRPEFFVLYNGEDACPDETVLRLSDAFNINIHDVKNSPVPDLELTVRVLNVNTGHNEKILAKCEYLQGYSVFVGKIREYRKLGQALEDAIKSAMEYCVSEGILADYLDKNGSEVCNMLLHEWKLEEAQQVWLEEAYEEVARAMFEEGISIEKIARVLKQPLELLKEKLQVQ